MDISAYSKSELTTALKGLKSYRVLSKYVGKRGRELFHRARSGKVFYHVEYFGEDYTAIESLIISAYKTYFDVSVSGEQITWKQNNTLKWGARVFIGDDMVNISFQEVENRLKRF